MIDLMFWAVIIGFLVLFILFCTYLSINVLSVTLPDFRWYRQLRGGLWYLVKIDELEWWTKDAPNNLDKIIATEIYP